jgi:poly(beta-D-mannuronate) lyase
MIIPRAISAMSAALMAAAAMVVVCAADPLNGARQAASAGKKEAFRCRAVPKPVVRLSFGSRYTEESEGRSDLDEDANEDVTKALAGIDNYVEKISDMANGALLSEVERDERIACFTKWLAEWARAGALTELKTTNAKLAAPSRLAGIASAYAQVKPLGKITREDAEVIEGWMIERAGEMIRFFETAAPRMASRNNLRLWAGFAATATGVATEKPSLIDWGQDTNRLVACAADDDGSLPQEMNREKRALHYQLYAVGPLVLTATFLEQDGRDGFDICDGKIEKVVDFTLRALENPGIVEDKVGVAQTFSKSGEKVEPYQMAWAEPYLARSSDPELEKFVARMRPLSNSKLGGNLSAIYGPKPNNSKRN